MPIEAGEPLDLDMGSGYLQHVGEKSRQLLQCTLMPLQREESRDRIVNSCKTTGKRRGLRFAAPDS